MLTAQEVFDRVWDHFVTKKNPRSVSGTNCYYRRDDGAVCAVGLFMDETTYDPSFEKAMAAYLISSIRDQVLNKTDRDVAIRKALMDDKRTELRELLLTHEALLCSLQNAHDDPACTEEQPYTYVKPERLRKVAEQYGLTVPGDAA